MLCKRSKYLFFGICICFFLSCEDYKDCNSPVETSLGVGFYRMTNGSERDSTLPALTMFGINRADSLLADSISVSRIYVPLNQNADSAGFFLQPDSPSGYGDTITVLYKRTLHFVSSGCGFTTFYNLDTVYFTQHYIDSVALVNRKIITTNATNLKIFY